MSLLEKEKLKDIQISLEANYPDKDCLALITAFRAAIEQRNGHANIAGMQDVLEDNDDELLSILGDKT